VSYKIVKSFTYRNFYANTLNFIAIANHILVTFVNDNG